ncbi:hypothetical protein VB780_05375 [Leptolyngbya sp. CCNP1308]|uniref:phage tail protein n=1 Tax=Leptolyngbya sp. CCNP1308 TaxID=3110255 RepID=UPI002B1F4339|nr:hypothetical protein [Leptolyngbya sp. CCNP1308]MEA5447990.1 hypothetical protein [Leptolyngbya sp. CCNP1308]
MNYEAAYLAKLEGIIVAMGGVVPVVTNPSSFERRSLELLDAIALASSTASASALLVGSSTLIPYPVTLANQLYTDPAGWLWYAPNGGSIGNVGSGSTVALAKLEQLFYRLWEHLGLATAGWSILTVDGVPSTAGATAAADWAAGKRLLVPDQRGRSPIAAGQGSGLTNRAIGSRGGAETHALIEVENATHGHGVNDPGHGHTMTISRTDPGTGTDVQAIERNGSFIGPQNYGVNNASTGITIQSQGSGSPHNNMQPWAAYTVLWFTGQKA